MIFFSKIFAYLLMRCPKSGPNPNHSWLPGDAVTAVRLTGVPASLPDAAIREHFSQFGRVTCVFQSKDKVFTRAANGIAHISIAVAPWFMLPAFVSLVDADGCTDKRMLVYTDASRRRCSRCGTSSHVAQFCRAGRRAPAPTTPSGASSAYR